MANGFPVRPKQRAGTIARACASVALVACLGGSGAMRESLAPVFVNACTMRPVRAAGGFVVNFRYVVTNRSAQTIAAVRIGTQTWRLGAVPLGAWDTGFPLDDRHVLLPGQREVMGGATGLVPASETAPVPGPVACKLVGVGFSDGTTWVARRGWFGPLESHWTR